MLNSGSFVNGIIIGLVLAAPVGPVGILCVQRALTEGRLHGLLSGLGAAVGDALYGAVAAFGVSAVAMWVADHLTALRLVGGAILLLLAMKSFLARPRGPTRKIEQRVHTESLVQDFVSALLLTVTNPVTLVAFAAIIVAMGDTLEGGALPLVIGVFLGSAAWWLALSSSVELFRAHIDTAFQIWVNRISGAILFALGVGAIASVVL